MGQGGTFVLINGTPYDWHLTYQHSYQMNSWPFHRQPTVPAHTSMKFYIEWDDNALHKSSDDGGEATYTLVGTSYSFQIQARFRYLQVQLQTIPTQGNPQGTTLSLGWKHDGVMPFSLSGTEGHFSSNKPPTDWMQSNLTTLDDLPLRSICMPGSHDAGMYKITGHTGFANAQNSQTQTKSILQQLTLGSRYLDCRPTISAGNFVSGHYSDVGGAIGWQGANGESFENIINDINTFTSTNKELVILNLSHDLNSDTGRSYRYLNQEEWTRLCQQLMKISDLFIAPQPLTTDLSEMTLKQFIGNGRAAVIVIAAPEQSKPPISLDGFNQRGIYDSSLFNVYNSYSDTQKVGDMSRDQLQKMHENKKAPTDPEFLLSWTLTQDSVSATFGNPTILQLASSAWPTLFTDVFPACSRSSYPNILYLDGWEDSDPTALAMAINNTFAS